MTNREHKYDVGDILLDGQGDYYLVLDADAKHRAWAAPLYRLKLLNREWTTGLYLRDEAHSFFKKVA